MGFFGRFLPAVLLLTVGASTARAQDVEELKKRKEKKLNEPWTKNGDWIFDYEQALKKAEETGKPIFAYFTRSYAY